MDQGIIPYTLKILLHQNREETIPCEEKVFDEMRQIEKEAECREAG